MKAIKENWKLVLIVAAGIIAVIFMCIFGVQADWMIIQLTPYRERLEIVAKVIFIKEKRRIKFMNFTVMQLIIMFLIAYVCLYALIDRVMKCIEHCATARAYGRFREAGTMIKMDSVAAGIAKSKEEKDNVEKGLN